jgi:hypothetical protein
MDDASSQDDGDEGGEESLLASYWQRSFGVSHTFEQQSASS